MLLVFIRILLSKDLAKYIRILAYHINPLLS
nr:MAG TPA: hypothetical protein [Caudoviricetes sp.]